MKKLIAISLLVAAGAFTGCYYDNMEDVYPGAGLFQPCDTASATSYTNHIVPIIQNNCVACHSGSGANADVHLDTYEGVRDVANSGQLMGVTWHESGYTPMPPNYQIDSCSLVQIKKWVLAGAPNN
jgi:hypothetical protein